MHLIMKMMRFMLPIKALNGSSSALPSNRIITEGGDSIITESGDFIVTE